MARKDLSTFERADLAKGRRFWLSIKSLHLDQTRRRYIESRKRSKRGRVARRPSDRGAIAWMDDRGTYSLFMRSKEVRGLAEDAGRWFFAEEDHVWGWRWFEHRHMAHIHSLDFSPDGKRLMVCSSGFEALLEFDMEGQLRWSHYFMGKTEQPIPTADREAFINTAVYDNGHGLILTAFHDGAVYGFHLDTRERTLLLDGLTCPHGGRMWRDELLVTDTAGGRVIWGEREFWFDGLEGNQMDVEWLQTTMPCDDLLVTVDSNRTRMVIFDPERELIDMVTYPDNWAVQDVIAL